MDNKIYSIINDYFYQNYVKKILIESNEMNTTRTTTNFANNITKTSKDLHVGET